MCNTTDSHPVILYLTCLLCCAEESIDGLVRETPMSRGQLNEWCMPVVTSVLFSAYAARHHALTTCPWQILRALSLPLRRCGYWDQAKLEETEQILLQALAGYEREQGQEHQRTHCTRGSLDSVHQMRKACVFDLPAAETLLAALLSPTPVT